MAGGGIPRSTQRMPLEHEDTAQESHTLTDTKLSEFETCSGGYRGLQNLPFQRNQRAESDDVDNWFEEHEHKHVRSGLAGARGSSLNKKLYMGDSQPLKVPLILLDHNPHSQLGIG